MSKIEQIEDKIQELEESYHSVECQMEWAWDTHQENLAQKSFSKLKKIESRLEVLKARLAKNNLKNQQK